jgi:hypothetical protein
MQRALHEQTNLKDALERRLNVDVTRNVASLKDANERLSKQLLSARSDAADAHARLKASAGGGNYGASKGTNGGGGGGGDSVSWDRLMVAERAADDAAGELIKAVGGATALVTFICVIFCLLLRWGDCSCNVQLCSFLLLLFSELQFHL